jgi:hypothetical protein
MAIATGAAGAGAAGPADTVAVVAVTGACTATGFGMELKARGVILNGTELVAGAFEAGAGDGTVTRADAASDIAAASAANGDCAVATEVPGCALETEPKPCGYAAFVATTASSRQATRAMSGLVMRGGL